MLIFISIALGCFIIVAGGFIFGHDHDVDGDHDVGHDGGADHAISIFSVKVLGTFGMGFGAAGAIASQYGLGNLAASGVGLGAGCVLAGIMYLFLSLIFKQQASSLVATSSLVGCNGVVTVEISADGLGEVGVSFGNKYSNFRAKSDKGTLIPKGRAVRVSRTTGSLVFVEEA